MHALIVASLVVLVVNFAMALLPLPRWSVAVLFMVSGGVFYAATKDIYGGMAVAGYANVLNVALNYVASVTQRPEDVAALRRTLATKRIPTL